jgi:two-component sensor histidine kinase
MNIRYASLLSVLLLPLFLNAQSPEIDSLQRILDESPADSTTLQALTRLSSLMNSYNLPKALEYGYQGLPLTEAQPDSKATAELYVAIGRTHANSSQPDSATWYFEKARTVYIELGDLAGEANVLSKLQWVAKYLGEYEKAARLAFEVLRIREEVGDPVPIAIATSDIGDALYNQSKYEEARKYAQEGYEQLKAIDAPPVDLGVAAQLLADIVLQLGEHETALQYADEALLARERAGDPLDIALSQNTRGNILKFMERYEEALEAYQSAREEAVATGFISLEMAVLHNTGDVYYRMGRYQAALPVFRSLVERLAETGEQFKLPKNLLMLSRTYEGLGQYDSALVYHIRYKAVSDSLFSEEADARVAELQTRYETTQKEATIAQQKEQLNRERTIRWYSFGFAGLLLLLALLMFQGYRTISRKNKAIEALMHEIHHRVKNNLQVLSSLLSLQSRYIKDENALDAIREGQNRVDAMGLIHQQLYTGDTPAALNMEIYLRELGETIADSFGFEEQQISMHYELSPIELDADTAIPVGLIANELITNALKYAFPDGRQGEITLHFSRPPQGGYLLKVQDDGVGKSKSDTPAGTAFGTRLIGLLSKKLRAEVKELDGPGYGASIWFE